MQLQKKKSGVKKCLEICAIKGGGRGGGRRLMTNTILNFHFDYPHTSLIIITNITIIISQPPPPLHGKYHLKFPFWLLDNLPKA